MAEFITMQEAEDKFGKKGVQMPGYKHIHEKRRKEPIWHKLNKY